MTSSAAQGGGDLGGSGGRTLIRENSCHVGVGGRHVDAAVTAAGGRGAGGDSSGFTKMHDRTIVQFLGDS